VASATLLQHKNTAGKKGEDGSRDRSRSRSPAQPALPRAPLTEEEQHQFLDMAISALLIARPWTRTWQQASRQAGSQPAPGTNAHAHIVPYTPRAANDRPQAKFWEWGTVKDTITTDERFVNVQPGQRWSALHQAAEATGAKYALCMCASLEPRHACTHLCVSRWLCAYVYAA
jgi:hypothetical protein